MDVLLDREHGTARCAVPLAWKRHATGSYCVSSLAFCLTGLVYLLLFVWGGTRRYGWEREEALLWTWSGLLSYRCDVVDLGVRSWSHPIDRASATTFITYLTLKHALLCVRGRLDPPEAILFPAGLAAGLACYARSCEAVWSGDRDGLFFWHSAWHWTLALGGCAYYWLLLAGGE